MRISNSWYRIWTSDIPSNTVMNNKF